MKKNRKNSYLIKSILGPAPFLQRDSLNYLSPQDTTIPHLSVGFDHFFEKMISAIFKIFAMGADLLIF